MSLCRNFLFLRYCGNTPVRCLYSTKSGSSTDATKGAATPPPPPKKPSDKTATTDDNTKYLSQEYYKHHEFSFYDVETSMSDKRVGQPSSRTK